MNKNENDNRDTREIDEIVFGIYSAEEIRKISVCKIDSSKLCSTDKNTGYGTVYDPRMGTIENGIICETCSLGPWQCVGHFSHIELNEPIVHPLHYKRVVDFLRCFCIKCFRLLITEDQIALNGLNRAIGVKRFNKILEKLEKIDMCIHCSQPQPDIKYTATDNSISMVYKQKDKDKSKISIVLPVDEIKNIFDNISIDDVKLLGFNPDLMQPRNLILTVFPVIPTTCRPYIISESNICDDDLTIQIVEIIKANNHLKIEDGVPVSETKRQKYIQSLKFRIATFYNNSCLSPETPVLMWNGSTKRADEIEVGDELVGDDGNKRNVLYTCSGEDDMYEIIQEKGDTYVVNKEHYLTFQYSGNKNIFWVKPNKNSPNGAYWMKWFEPSINKIKNKIVSVLKNRTKEKALKIITDFSNTIDDNNIFDVKVKDYLKMPESYKDFFIGIKLDKYLNWGYKDISIDPYLVGMWLGDGNSNGKGFTTEDVILLDYWKSWAKNNEAEIILYPHKINNSTKHINFRYHDYQISDPELYRPDIHYGVKSIHNIGYKRNHKSPLKDALNKYKLLNNKHIPDDFLYTDVNTRLKILAGIIDTDGYVNKDGTSIVISQCDIREKLVRQIHFLAKTLGFYSSIKEIFKTFNNKKYRGFSVYISGNISIIPTLLKRKTCKNITRYSLRSNFKVKYMGKGLYNGFGVDKNHRFLLGDFTITHNSGKAKHSTNGRAIKGLKERITGKDGLVRVNLMGKRCEQTGRTVIGPDPTLKTGQVAVPPEMANILTVPIQVTNYNIGQLTDIVNNGKANFVIKKDTGIRINLEHKLFFRGTTLEHGDIIIRTDPKTEEKKEIIVTNGKDLIQPGDRLKRNGELITDIKYPEKRDYHLNIGDVVERRLIDGDILLLNRQPTLHEGSMMGMEVVVRKGKTLRFNLAIAKSFNADFDKLINMSKTESLKRVLLSSYIFI